MPIIKHTTDTNSAIYKDALAIRKKVFIEEQQVDEALEIDQDEQNCLHFVLYKHEQPVATCRLLKKDEHLLKLQRMAVLKEERKENYGRKIMAEAEKVAKELGYETIILGGQVTAIGFYERLGYQTYGEEFMDANIPHYMMKKALL